MAALVVALAVLGMAAAFFAAGPEKVWIASTGPSDQGPVDVLHLQRRARANDSLACSPALCAGRTDILLPVYPGDPEALAARLDRIVLADHRNLRRVDDGTRAGVRRYVALTPILRFPDTIDAVAVAVPGGTGLALYGRSKLGTHDFGVNRARMAAWVEQL